MADGGEVICRGVVGEVANGRGTKAVGRGAFGSIRGADNGWAIGVADSRGVGGSVAGSGAAVGSIANSGGAVGSVTTTCQLQRGLCLWWCS